MPAALVDGVAARLLAPAVAVTGELTIADKRGDTQLRLTSCSTSWRAASSILPTSCSRASPSMPGCCARRCRPNLAARIFGCAAGWRASSPEPLVDYLVTATSLRYDKTVITAPRVSGVVQIGRSPGLSVPVTASASRISGAGGCHRRAARKFAARYAGRHTARPHRSPRAQPAHRPADRARQCCAEPQHRRLYREHRCRTAALRLAGYRCRRRRGQCHRRGQQHRCACGRQCARR